MRRPAPVRDAVLALLRQRGPMTVQQMSEDLDLAEKSVREAVLRARRKKEIHIADWFTPPLHERGLRRAMHAIGNRPDVPMPAVQPGTYQHRYRMKNRALLRLKDQIRRHGPLTPFTQMMIYSCQSAPKKQPSAKA